MRPLNIVLFSSGVSEQNGILQTVKESFSKRGYQCRYWRDLFAGANDPQNIALLPTLLKKIPTFDFAVLICEGHDEIVLSRSGKQETARAMRDNVLFEIGLCAMALGLPRTILLTDGKVRMPDDLIGKRGKLAVQRFNYDAESTESQARAGEEAAGYIERVEKCVNRADQYITAHVNDFTPVVIGAAVNTASGYVDNFVFRTLEQIGTGVEFCDSVEKKIYTPENIFLHILLPLEYNDEVPKKVTERMSSLRKASVPAARMRKAEFFCEEKDGKLHIYDCPTSLVTSYDTAKIILSLDADDTMDPEAKKRFVSKELDLFENTLRTLVCEDFLRQTLHHNYKMMSEEEREAIFKSVSRILQNTAVERTL